MKSPLAKKLAAIAEQDKKYNAFITLDTECAANNNDKETTAPTAPLYGFMLGVKDNIHVAGLPCTGGCAALQQFIPGTDASVVAKLKAAGAIVVGKTNLHELGFGITNNNAAFGATHNAVHPEYIAGGSSGGSAVAVARGFVDAALGTDTGGSCRIPAALNGIAGFRPSNGRYANDGLLMISNTRDTIGILANDVTGVEQLDTIIADEPANDNPIAADELRLGVPREHFYTDLDTEVAEIMENTLATLRSAGVTLVEADMQVVELSTKTSFSIVLYETAQLLPAYLQKYGIDMNIGEFCAAIKSPDVKSIIAEIMNGAVDEKIYLQALQVYRPRLRERWQTYFHNHQIQAVVFPTTPLAACPLQNCDENVTVNGQTLPTFPTYIRNVDPASTAGAPAISIPMGCNSQGLPVGLEIAGPVDSDRQLLAVASTVESVLRNN